MGKLQAALDWAARGFPVFPLVVNGKTPLYEGTWYEDATTDPDTIRAMWTDPVLRRERNYNIGMDCTGRVVYDVDVKEGKDGINQYAQMGGTYDTLVVQTPTGGYHCYFEGPDSANVQDMFGEDGGIDVRSHHGYVVAPGSTIDGVAYEVVNDVDPIWITPELEAPLKDPYERRESSVEGSLDSEASIDAGRRFLESAPVAIEGDHGDETTFKTAARLVREFALSVPTAYELMAEHWNERCLPPWQLDELLEKVENAASYGTADLGRLDPSVAFRTVSVEPPPTVFQQKDIGFGNAVSAFSIPPRPWMLDRILMQRDLTLLLAPGAAGKSSVSLAIAAHMAMGENFGPYKCHGACKSIVYNGEDDTDEQSRRLYAVCLSYGFDYATVNSQIMLLSGDDLEMKLVVPQGRTAVANEVMVNQIIEIASDPDVGLVIYDPLVDLHDVDEGDNPQMNTVMRTMKHIAREANVSSLILHHTTKAGSSKQEDRIGNMDIARGASGIVYKSRIAFTLLNASHQDAEDYGFQEHERNEWVRLDDAKMQYTLASTQATWFHKEGMKIPNGDVVGVLKLTEMKKNTNRLRVRIAELLIGEMMAMGAGSLTLLQAVAMLKLNEPLWSNHTDAAIRQKLEGMYSTAVEIEGTTLRLERKTEGAKSHVLITIT